MGNIIAAKAFQGKYKDTPSCWTDYGIEINQGDSIEDDTFVKINPSCKKTRNASVVIVDGIRLLNERGVRRIGLTKSEVEVKFDANFVSIVNSKVGAVLKINEPDRDHCNRLSWVEETSGDGISSVGDYYTTSTSRGETKQGQGAVDFLTTSILFGEALRNLLFDKVKNRISLIVLERFITYRRFMDANQRQILNKTVSGTEVEKMRRMLIELCDALYMSGAYYKTDNEIVKRHMETKVLYDYKASQPCEDEVIGKEIFNPDYLARLVKAYT